AVQSHHTALVHFLLDRTVDPNDSTEHEDTALHIAAKLNADDIAVILLQKGANVDAVNKDGGSPLHVATENCLVVMAELLLRHGANVNVVDNDDRSCLMLACRLGAPQLVGLFLEYGSNRKLRDKSGLTAAEYAIISQQNECLKLMGEEVGGEVEVVEEEEEVDWKINDDLGRSSSRLNSWNDESEKENQKELLPNLNLNKFLASLDDSDKDVSGLY
uniref:Uncharacterized protein n=1 Tax=Strigamia maritima TaxID=126957 RepID=T1JK05_STRMM